MKALLKCSQCNEVLGTLSKEEITKEDRTLYRETTLCSQGEVHANSVELIIIPPLEN